jgi:hypothetical protein
MASPPRTVPSSLDREYSWSTGCRNSCRAAACSVQAEMTYSTVWSGAPQGHPMGRSGLNLAVYEPMKAWVVISRISVQKAAQLPFLAPRMRGGNLPVGGWGKATIGLGAAVAVTPSRSPFVDCFQLSRSALEAYGVEFVVVGWEGVCCHGIGEVSGCVRSLSSCALGGPRRLRLSVPS